MRTKPQGAMQWETGILFEVALFGYRRLCTAASEFDAFVKALADDDNLTAVAESMEPSWVDRQYRSAVKTSGGADINEWAAATLSQ